MAQLEGELNGLLKQQGKLNNEVKEIKRLKKRLMEEIVSLMGEEGYPPPRPRTHRAYSCRWHGYAAPAPASCDSNTIERIGIPACVLMERAALAAVEAIEEFCAGGGRAMPVLVMAS